MTRINVGVHPSELSTKHLIAEHREIKRIPNMIKSGRAIVKDIPTEFNLGEGSVKFFYDKVYFLQKRYIEIYSECKKRNFAVTDFSNAFSDIPKHLNNDYIPTSRDREIILNRIKERTK